MNQPYQAPDWSGLTVVIVGNAPDMTAEQAIGRADKTIAVHNGLQYAPNADLYVALDPSHHVGLDFAGLRVVGSETDDDGAMCVGHAGDNVRMSDFETLNIRNNLLAAMRIAAASGASRIVLVGVDTAAYEAKHNFRGLSEGLIAIVAELESRGIAVEGAIGGPDLHEFEAPAPRERTKPRRGFVPGDEQADGA